MTVIGPTDREILCESDLEANVCLCLFAHPDVFDVVEQPAPVAYVDDGGVLRSHTFDFIAILRDGTRVAVLVKPACKAEKYGLKRLVEVLAAQTPRHVAQRFKLMTDEDLDPVRINDAKLINAARLDPDGEADATLLALVASLNGETTIGTLVKRSGVAGIGFRAAVRLVANGTLVRIGHGFLNHDTVVAKREAF